MRSNTWASFLTALGLASLLGCAPELGVPPPLEELRLREVVYRVDGIDAAMTSTLTYDDAGKPVRIETSGLPGVPALVPQTLELLYDRQGRFFRVDEVFGGPEHERVGHAELQWAWENDVLHEVSRVGWERLNDHADGEPPSAGVEIDTLWSLEPGASGRLMSLSATRVATALNADGSAGATTSEEVEHLFAYVSGALREADTVHRHTDAAGTVVERPSLTSFRTSTRAFLERVTRDDTQTFRIDIDDSRPAMVTEADLPPWSLQYEDGYNLLASATREGASVTLVYEVGRAALTVAPRVMPGAGLLQLNGWAEAKAEPTLFFGQGGRVVDVAW